MINPSSDTGDGGQTVSAYTAQFGNGLSATLSLEAPRTTDVFCAALARHRLVRWHWRYGAADASRRQLRVS